MWSYYVIAHAQHVSSLLLRKTSVLLLLDNAIQTRIGRSLAAEQSLFVRA